MTLRHYASLFALAVLARLSPLLGVQALLPASAPWGPLPVWVQPLLDHRPGAWLALALAGLLADAFSAVLLARLVDRRRLAERLLAPQRQDQRWASPGFWAGLAWALHPVAATLAGSAGAWQSLALLALLAGAWDLEYNVHEHAEARAALYFGLAISAALWPLLLLPLGAAGLLSRRERARFYARALVLPLLLLGPWLLLQDATAVLAAWLGPPSLLGLPGALTALWAAASAPAPWLETLVQGWRWAALAALVLFWLRSFWRPAALMPGLALSAWAWILACPSLQGPLLLAPLGLALLVPGRLAWRLMAVTLPLLVLQDHWQALRGLHLQPAQPGQGQMAFLLWAALGLAWLFWVALEWSRLWAYAHRPQGPSSLR